MLTIIIRAIIIYVLVLFVFRFMGKRQLGEMQPFELVLTLIIADLATIPMAEISIPLLNGVVPLLTLFLLHFLLTFISRKSVALSKFINGKPAIVITPDGIDYKVLKSLDISVDDLFESIRNCNYYSLEQIGYAIFETTGTVNVIPKPQFAPATLGNLKDNVSEKTVIPYTLVSEGTFMENNANILKVSKNFIENIVKKQNTKSLKNVLVLTLDISGKVFYQEINKPCKCFQINFGDAK